MEPAASVPLLISWGRRGYFLFIGKKLFPRLLKIDGVDTRREHKLTAGTVKNVRPCTFFTYKICIAQISFLHGTTAIHGGTDTLRIISSGMDAAGIKQQRCFRCAETRH